MSLKHTAVRWRIIVPDPNSGISGATGNEPTWWVDGNIIDWALMPDEFVRTSVGFQGGGENHTVVRAGDDLLHVGTEHALGDFVFMLKERLY